MPPQLARCEPSTLHALPQPSAAKTMQQHRGVFAHASRFIGGNGCSLHSQRLQRRAVGCPATRPALESRRASGVHALFRIGSCSGCEHRMHRATARDTQLDAVAQEEKGLVSAVDVRRRARATSQATAPGSRRTQIKTATTLSCLRGALDAPRGHAGTCASAGAADRAPAQQSHISPSH